MMSVDTLINLLGKTNLYVIFWYCVVNFLKSASSCGAILAFLWANAKPRSIRCKLPPGYQPNDSLPYELVKDKWIPSQCEQYVNFSRDTNQTQPCQLGYVYESYMDSSVITEWDLVCDRKYLGALADSSFFILSVLASSAFTALADRFGRRPVFISCLLLMNAAGFLSTFSPNAYVYIAIRLLIGPLQQGTYTIGFCYSVELFPMERRSFPTLLSEVFWVASSLLLCLIVYFVKSWKIYYYVTTLPFATGILLIWFMPESIPWLFAKGRFKEAYDTLNKGASYMKDEDEVLEKIEIKKRETENYTQQEDEEENNEIYPCYFVCTRQHIQKWTFINTFVWLTVGMSYYGFQIYGTSFGNIYLNFFLLAIIELPAVISTSIASRRLGRKFMIFVSYVIMGTIFLVLFLGLTFAYSLTAMNTVLVVAGRFFASVIFTVVFLHASEMYPTSLRSMGVAIGTSSARFGIALAPFLSLLADLVNWLPTLIIISFCYTSACLYLLVPETRRWPLPQSLDDVYAYRVEPKFQDPLCSCCMKQRVEVVDDNPVDDPGRMEMQGTYAPTNDDRM